MSKYKIYVVIKMSKRKLIKQLNAKIDEYTDIDIEIKLIDNRETFKAKR